MLENGPRARSGDSNDGTSAAAESLTPTLSRAASPSAHVNFIACSEHVTIGNPCPARLTRSRWFGAGAPASVVRLGRWPRAGQPASGPSALSSARLRSSGRALYRATQSLAVEPAMMVRFRANRRPVRAGLFAESRTLSDQAATERQARKVTPKPPRARIEIGRTSRRVTLFVVSANESSCAMCND